MTLINWYSSHIDFRILIYFREITKNTLGGGIFLVMGMLLYDSKLTAKIGRAIILLLISSSIVLKYIDAPYWEIIGGISFFIIAIKLPTFSHSLMLNLRTQSMWIYYIHEYFLFIFFCVLTIENYIQNPWIIMALVLFIIAIAAYILSKLQKCHRFKFLNFIVS